MTDAELAFKTGYIFNKKITSAFWSSFKGEYGRVQIEVLVYLLEVDSAQASEIVSELNISKQHVSRILKEFISVGYVDTVNNPNDKRANYVSISKKGRKYLEEHIKISDKVFEDILLRMNENDKKEFLEALNTVYMLLNDA